MLWPTELWSHWRWEQVHCGFICSRERDECEWCIWNKSYMNCGNEFKWRMILAVVEPQAFNGGFFTHQLRSHLRGSSFTSFHFRSSYMIYFIYITHKDSIWTYQLFQHTVPFDYVPEKNNGGKPHSSLSQWKDNLTGLRKWTKHFFWNIANVFSVEPEQAGTLHHCTLTVQGTGFQIQSHQASERTYTRRGAYQAWFKRRAIVVPNSVYQIKLDVRETVARRLNQLSRQVMLHVPLLLFCFSRERGVYCSRARSA